LIGSEESNFIFIGNLFHPHCLLSDYVCNDQNNPWINRRYAAVERLPDRRDLWDQWGSIYNFKEDFEGGTGQKAALAFYEKNKADMDKGAVLLWPERYALYDLMILRNENEISFMSEMQNEPMDPKRVVFHTDEFHYWDENFKTLDEFLRSLDLEFFAGCDPALGKNMEKGDYSAIVVLARDKKPPYTLYIVTADIRRRSVEELEDDILSYCKRYKFVKFGIESNQFQVLITRSLRKKADSLGIRVPFIEINSKGDKIARLQLLNLLVKTGALQFSRRHKELLEECRYFPKGKFDDGLDALEMAVQLAEGRNTVDPKENKKMLEDCKMKIHAPRPGKRADEYFIVNGKMVKNVFNLLKVNQLRPPIEDNGKKS
jgi:predicted phage terminase large subunit-like protein